MSFCHFAFGELTNTEMITLALSEFWGQLKKDNFYLGICPEDTKTDFFRSSQLKIGFRAFSRE